MAKTNTPATRQQAPGPPAQAPPPARPPKTIRDILEQHVDRIATVLPKHLTPDRMIALVSNIVYRTPKLQQCDPMSIVSSVQQASALGLDLMPTTGEAYLVPVWNKKINNGRGGLECQFRPGFRGLAKLVKQSGAVVDIVSDLVYARDRFFYRRTPALEFDHTPYLGPEDRGEVTNVYALAELPSGKYEVEHMTAADVEKIHARSESYQAAAREQKAEYGPWVSDWGEMARKTVIRRLTKRFPMSPEVALAVEAMDRDYDLDAPARVGARLPARRGVSGLRAQLELDEPTLPPSPSRVYSEADDVAQDPGDAADVPGVEDYTAEGAGDDARES